MTIVSHLRRYIMEAIFKEKSIDFTNVDLDTISDIAIALNDMAKHEGLSAETLRSMAEDTSKKMDALIERTKMY